MGVLKREVSLSRRDIHSVLLCSARPTEWGAADGRTDRQRWAGGDGMKNTKDFLADHYLTHRQQESNQHSSQFLLFFLSFFSPRSSILSQQMLSTTDSEISKGAEDTERNTHPESHPDFTDILRIRTAGCVYSLYICWLCMTPDFNTVVSVRSPNKWAQIFTKFLEIL